MWIAISVVLLCVSILGTVMFLRLRTPAEDPLTLANAAYERKDWAKAAELARARLKADGGDQDALRILARSSIRLGRDPAGVTIYNDRLGAKGMQPEDRFLAGMVLARQGDDQAAMTVWSKAVQEGPEHPEMMLTLANSLARHQRLDEAAGLAQRVSRIPGWEAPGLLLTGINRFTLEDYAGSADALRRGLELDPEARLAQLEPSLYLKTLARCLLNLGQPEEADRWLEPLLKEARSTAPDPEVPWLASRSALQQHQLDRARSELAKAGNYRAEHPLDPEPSPYVGEAKCAPCHREIVKAHGQTRHARTFHHAEELLSLPRPPGPLADADYPDAVHEVVQEGKKLEFRTKVDDRVYRTLIDYAFGTTDRYFSLVGRDEQGNFRAARKSYFHEGGASGWGPTAGDAGHTDRIEHVRGQTIHVRDGVVRCLHCHVTNPREFRDGDKDGTGPEARDKGIGCERCHGPGGNHIIASESDFPDWAIVNVGTGSADSVTKQCRDCHIVGDASEIDHRREEPIWVRSPGATMTFSRCYTESDGAMSCLTCHDPHRDSERSPRFYEERCLACHSGEPSTAATVDYLGIHRPKDQSDSGEMRLPTGTKCKVNPDRDCLTCHMPKVRQPVLHTDLTDHFIRVHREQLAR